MNEWIERERDTVHRLEHSKLFVGWCVLRLIPEGVNAAEGSMSRPPFYHLH